MFGINQNSPETHFRKLNEVFIGINKTGINYTNITKLFRIIQIKELFKYLIIWAKQHHLTKKPVANVCSNAMFILKKYKILVFNII
jgi:hypothetical protein